MPEGQLQGFLLDTLDDVGDDFDELKKRLEEWYDSTMDRATGWYKRKVHRILLIIGLSIAVIFNADTLSIYDKLSNDPDARAEVLAVAQNFVDRGLEKQQIASDSIGTIVDTAGVARLMKMQGEIQRLVSEDIGAVRSPLGLGWSKGDFKELSQEGYLAWLKKILGFIVTALAISLGAPFWFDLLKKMMNVRTSGK